MIGSKKGLDFANLISVMQKPSQNYSQMKSNFQRKDSSATPTKIHSRINSSPLKVPLEKVSQKALRDRSPINRSPSRSKISGRSSKNDDSSILSMGRRIYQCYEPEERQLKAHTQTQNFIKKYFDFSIPQIPIDMFIYRILQQFEGLWGNQNAEQILQDFTYKIHEIFGSQSLQIRQLVRITKNDGMVGLILQIFKGIKKQQTVRMSAYESFHQNPDVLNIHKSFQSRLQEDQSIINIKNVVQQFIETIYLCMQKQIYNKFNVQMRRMVLKYRETERILKKINQKLTMHADIFHLQKKLKDQEKFYQIQIQEQKKIKSKLESASEREKQKIYNLKQQRDKMQQQINRLKDNLERYQNAILNKALQNVPIMNAQTPLSRKNINSDMIHSQNLPSQPLKVHIDTHIMHRDYGPPQMQTVTTFLHSSVSPSKKQGENRFQASKFGNSAYNRGNSSPFNINLPYQTKSYR